MSEYIRKRKIDTTECSNIRIFEYIRHTLIYRSNPLSILVFRYPRSIHSRLAEIVIKFLYFRCQAGSGHCVIDKVANLTQFSLEEIQNIASDVLKHFNRTRIQSQLSKSRYSGSTELQQIQSNCSLLNLVNF